jgi:N-acetylglucosaminyldiphosphoundecaprenol N-acetyl-beta-D-mannosaminyltransferase
MKEGSTMDRIDILGFLVCKCTYEELLEAIKHAIEKRIVTHIVTANAAMLTTALADGELEKCLSDADIITADGMSVVWAAQFLGQPLKGRITGIDATWKIIKQAEECNHTIFLLGAKQSVIESVAQECKMQFPQLRLGGYHNGYFDHDKDVIESITRCQPDILLVGMGFSLQEKWIHRFKDILHVPVVMGVGGSFDVIAGNVKRAPPWIQAIGMEWSYRLMQEPGRLWKRYLVTNSIFIYKVLAARLLKKH